MSVFAKGEYFTAQFKFEYVGGDKYPLGVKGTYRKYAKDRVYRIVKEAEDEKTPFSIGYTVQVVNTSVFPLNGKIWSPLTALPTLPLEPVPVWCDFDAHFTKLLAELLKKYGSGHVCIEQWNDIRSKLPTSASTSEFAKRQPLTAPLKDMLFGALDVLTCSTVAHSKQRKRAQREPTYNGKKVKETYSTEHIRISSNKGMVPPPFSDYPPGANPVVNATLAADPEFMRAKKVWADGDINTITKPMLLQAIDDINKTISGKKKSKTGNKDQLLYSINLHYHNITL